MLAHSLVCWAMYWVHRRAPRFAARHRELLSAVLHIHQSWTLAAMGAEQGSRGAGEPRGRTRGTAAQRRGPFAAAADTPPAPCCVLQACGATTLTCASRACTRSSYGP